MDRLLTASANWHNKQIAQYNDMNAEAEFHQLLKTLSYRSTDGEYSKVMDSIRGKVRAVAIRALRDELERINRESAPEVLYARDQLEVACRDVDTAKEHYGEFHHLTIEAAELVIQKDAALEAIIWTATNHPEILDAADDDRLTDALRSG